MSRRYFILVIALTTTSAFADVFTYEGESLPEAGGWDVVQVFCDPDMWLAGGSFFVHVDFCDPFPPHGGQQASYRRDPDAFLNEQRFFVEWRVETDVDHSQIPFGGVAAFALGNDVSVDYTFFVSRDVVELNRDNLLPIVFVPIEPGVAHVHRLELYGDELYVWYIDGEIMDSGVPEGLFPTMNPRVSWVTSVSFIPHTTEWDYIRYGTIPTDGSGDFDSDGDIDGRDSFYFAECVADRGNGPGIPADPGCRWADMNQDGDVDFHDFALFQLAFAAPE